MSTTTIVVDCHAHVYAPQFPQHDLAGLLQDAQQRGIGAIVAVPECLEDCEAVLALAAAEPLIQPCAGLHPVQPAHAGRGGGGARCVALEQLGPALDFIRDRCEQLVAVGEVGLDFSPHVVGRDDRDAREVQQRVFAAQISAANDLGLPLNVHSRAAGHHAVDALVANGARGALLHAFDGRAVHALRAASAGFYLSVPASVVRSPHMQKLVAQLPLDRLVLETDAPALAPEAGTTNTPANAWLACEYVAKAKGLTRGEVAAITTANARKLFPKLQVARTD